MGYFKSKKRLKVTKNGKKGGRPRTKPDSSDSESNQTDDYEPPTKTGTREFKNSASAFLLTAGVLQSIIHESIV